jgi:hypothetical protein
MGTQIAGSFEASYRAYMTALFVGVADAFLCLLAVFALIGVFYMVIRRFFRKGDLIFFIIFAMLTIWFVWASTLVSRLSPGYAPSLASLCCIAATNSNTTSFEA